jgi:PAS domain S-box-containing protein
VRENDSFSLFASVKTVSELLRRKIADAGVAHPRGELEAGLEEIEALWEELRHQAEVMAGERQRYSEFFDYAPDAYLITDPNGNIREANRAAAELLGVSARMLDGKPLASYVPEEARRDFRARLVRAGAQPDGEVSDWRGALKGAQGRRVEAHFRVRSMPAPDSNIAPLCWLVRAI